MTTRISVLLYLFFGLLCGFLIGTSLDEEISVIVGRIIFTIAIFLLVILWQPIETSAHKRHLELWRTLRQRGKWLFILSRYVLLRGTVLAVIVLAPFLRELIFNTTVSIILLLSLALLIPTLSFLGYEEWKRCEQEFHVLALRQAAEETRRVSSLTN